MSHMTNISFNVPTEALCGMGRPEILHLLHEALHDGAALWTGTSRRAIDAMSEHAESGDVNTYNPKHGSPVFYVP